MYSLLLVILYMAFISLGLGDSLLGSAWPAMHEQLGSPVTHAGIISMTIAAGMVTSNLLADRLAKKFGARLLAIFSVSLSALSLFGFSLAGSFFFVWLWAFPYGLGGGALDAGINNYVAANYKSRHMNWLHCFWGVGAMTGPAIMGFYLTGGFEWSAGYRTVAFIQMGFVLVLILSLPLWKKQAGGEPVAAPVKPFSEILKLKGVKFVLPAFFAYCAIEATTGLWASTYLVSHRGISPEAAAAFTSLFFIGITAGRFLSGFVSVAMGNKKMIKTGIFFIFAGIAGLWLPVQTNVLGFAGLIVIGLGCAPIFPAIIHSTAENFGKENSQALVGLQIASANTGIALMPPLFGLLAGFAGAGVLPAFLALFAVLLLVMTVALNRATRPA
ncbi:MAG: MFS transporter [Spirochaetes bacterium]|nr:MFS transporter [Spirochaetota bacterium]